MRLSQVCKHQVCDYCGGRFGMVTHRWWGDKFCKKTRKNAYLRENHHQLGSSLSFCPLVAPVLSLQLQLLCSPCCLRPPTQRRAKSDQ